MRFRVERRSGRVAVYDTEHPEYQDTPGCLDDYPWTVCSWHGTFDEKAGHWNVDQRWVDKARATCELLNTLSANNTGERPETRSERRHAMTKFRQKLGSWLSTVGTRGRPICRTQKKEN